MDPRLASNSSNPPVRAPERWNYRHVTWKSHPGTMSGESRFLYCWGFLGMWSVFHTLVAEVASGSVKAAHQSSKIKDSL